MRNLNQEQWQKVEQVVDQALTLDRSERDTFIDQQCKEKALLKRWVTEFLESIEASEGFLEDDSYGLDSYLKELNSDTDAGEPSSSLIGKDIGSYRITDLVDHGGMGSVFKASRTGGDFEHTVALKVIRRGMDTPSNIARFKREQQILAGLNHPYIARLYDGGITADGLPYLLMEYIDGLPIDTYCDNNRLTVEERIQLFLDVCEAVQFAHRNLVIHRDLKPANILVDNEGCVKILDFGIAKLLDTHDTETTVLQTQPGSRILTPAYAAPEQIQNQSVTTSADNYALGTLLYRLLCGVPYMDFDKKSVSGIEAMVCNQEPDKPSKRYASLPQAEQQQIASRRNTTPDELKNKLTGDVDAIILKQLRKEPDARYGSAGHLAEELRRHQEGLPVQAQKDSFGYYLSKYIKRNKVPFSTAAVFVLLLIGFAAFHALRITDERNKATIQAEKSEQISAFLIDLFSASDPSQSLGDTLSVNMILAQGLKKIDQLDHQPEIKSQMLHTMGQVYTNLGNFEKAEELLVESLLILQNHDGASVDIASIHNNLGVLYHRSSDLKAAEVHYRKALKLKEEALGKVHPDYAQSLSDLGALMRVQGKMDSAEYYSQRAYALRQQLPEGNQLDIATSLNNLAVLAKELGDLDKSERFYLEALSIRRTELGSIHPKIANTLNNLGVLLRAKGDFEKAEAYYQEALDMRIRLLGTDHPQTAQSYNNFAGLLLEKGNLDKAIEYYQQALDIRKRIFSPGDIKIGNSYNNLANALLKKGQLDDAEKSYQRAIDIYTSLFGDEHRYVGVVKSNLGRVLTAKGALGEADMIFRSAYSILNHSYESEHISVANLLGYMAELEIQKKDLAKAVEYLEEALAIRRKLLGANHPDIIENNARLNDLYSSLNSTN